MIINNSHNVFVKREEGLILLDSFERTNMTGMKCYGDTGAFIRVGNRLRKMKDEDLTMIDIDLLEYLDFSLLLLTNQNLIIDEKTNIDEKSADITKKIYRYYGTGTGILFGIPSSLKPSVESVVKCVLKLEEEK